MISINADKIRDLIETAFSGPEREEALLFHVSVERKAKALILFYELVEKSLPNFVKINSQSTSSLDRKEAEEIIDIKPLLSEISAYIDAFFMSGRSTMDAFAHEIRSIYGLGGHTGNLYFSKVPSLLRRFHDNSRMSSYFQSNDVENQAWYKELNIYRHASTHESIIPFMPSISIDPLTSEWKKPILKLPIDPTSRPLQYNSKNFVDIGKSIREGLSKLLVGIYDEILQDIVESKTKITSTT
jgi:hypothetical protein